MVKTQKAYEHLLNLMDRVVNRLYAMHNEAHEYGTGQVLHRAEIHTIQAIGDMPGINNAALAHRLDVTKGAVSQIVSKLQKKGLVRKARLTTDSREVALTLTELGRTGYAQHEEIHGHMHDVIKGYFGERLQESLREHTAVMEQLDDILDVMDGTRKHDNR